MTNVSDRLRDALSGLYRIDRELGAGGMATVYLAHDLKHDRDVAIKVLHPDLGAALGGERFLSEIRTTARLQHPHILPLLDSGAADGLLYYVMPLVTGESLRARLERERQLPIADAVRIAREVASALDYAHRQNVIHRDIKPENILLHDGSALVADFGIALAVQSAGGQRMTQTGLSLGTPQYMSPEQAMGERTIDARSDVYALGAMTYEMLSGEPPFTGPTVQAIVAKVLSTEPAPLPSLRKAVPAHVAAAVHAALEKLPADRCESAKAFGEQLADARGTFAQAAASVSAAQQPAASWRTSRWVVIGAGAIAVASLSLAIVLWQRTGDREAYPAVQLTLELPSGGAGTTRFAVSGDGTRFAFSTDDGLALREAGQREYRLLEGTNDAEAPTFSPDGDWIAYNADGRLLKVPVAGGAPVAIIAGDTVRAGRVHWGEDGTIVFESNATLAVLPVEGPLRRLSKAIAAEQPRMTPDGRGVLYVDNRQNARLMYYDLALDSTFLLIEGAAEGQLLPTGHLIYGSSVRGLFAVRLAASRHAVEGTPVPVVSDLQTSGGVAPFVVTKSGTLVYRAGVEPESRIVVRQPSGAKDTLPIAAGVFSYARFAPDGRHAAFTIGSTRGPNRYTAIYDFDAGTLTRLTTGGGAHAPVWSPDSKSLAYTAETPSTDAEDVFVQPIDRSRPPRQILRTSGDQHATSWPFDTLLLFTNTSTNSSPDRVASGNSVDLINPVSSGAPRRFLQGAWGESEAAVSGDGRWVAYNSMESGTLEIHVRRMAGDSGMGHWRISSAGGARARWSADGRTLFYLNLDRTAIMATTVTLGASVVAGATRPVVQGRFGSAWDIDPRTGRIIVAETIVEASERIVVVQHWLDQFRREQLRAP